MQLALKLKGLKLSLRPEAQLKAIKLGLKHTTSAKCSSPLSSASSIAPYIKDLDVLLQLLKGLGAAI
jgi:hypothetical protein